MDAHGGDDVLQIVAALAGHADFVALNLCRDLELAVAYEAGDLLGHARLDAVLQLDALARVAERREVGFALLDAFHAHAALGELADNDLIQRAGLVGVLGGHFNFRLFQKDFPFAALEVEAVGEFLFGLVDGVFHFHGVDLRDDVE